ncbi:MAG: NrdH-redoxin [Actinomycetia bacterium]|nr:NrdH-redoxin [Actinomycetes bacterium]
MTDTTDTAPERAQLVVYTTSWCGPCTRLKNRLTERGITFDEVDVEANPDAADWVAEANGGSWMVPTVRLPDGTAMVNPAVAAVVERLAALTI